MARVSPSRAEECSGLTTSDRVLAKAKGPTFLNPLAFFDTSICSGYINDFTAFKHKQLTYSPTHAADLYAIETEN
jgi:hypothetical protein